MGHMNGASTGHGLIGRAGNALLTVALIVERVGELVDPVACGYRASVGMRSQRREETPRRVTGPG
jgi:hypothetical protein